MPCKTATKPILEKQTERLGHGYSNIDRKFHNVMLAPTHKASATPQQQNKTSQQSQTISLNHVIDWDTDHAISLKYSLRQRLGPCQGDRQRKQQNGPTVDQRRNARTQEGTRQVDEPRQGFLPTCT